MDIDLDAVDRDGALRETAARAAGDTRAAFLRRAGLLGGGLLAAAALPSIAPAVAPAPARAAAAGDVAILNFALTLEELEAAFYREALMMGALDGPTLAFARTVAAHEAAHVEALRGVLGSAAIARPSFDFKGTTSDADAFRRTAAVLEDTGVAAYKGQAPQIADGKVLAAALAIHAVEARHASWVRHLLGEPPAPAAFDAPKTRDEVLAAVRATGFITSTPTMSGAASPSFTG